MVDTRIVTRLEVDASGATRAAADFTAAMDKMRNSAEKTSATMSGGPNSFDGAMQRFQKAAAANDPVLRAQIRMQQEVERVTNVAARAVVLGGVSQAAAGAEIEKTRVRYQGYVDAARRSEFATTAFGKATEGVKGQLIALSAGLGPAGVFLAGMGPQGFAAAAGFGVALFAIDKLRGAAHEFAAEMGRLRDSAETLGLTSLQLQAINDEGAKFALTEDKIGQALQRFTAQMEEFRRGQGDLFNLTRRIDPALALEMAQARDTATSINYLAQVYEKAGNARQRLDRIIAGKAGGTVGLLFQDIGRQGGVDPLTEAFRKSGDAIDENLIKKVNQLKREIDDMSADARRNFESIFSERFLELQKIGAENWRDFSRTAKEFTTSDDLKKFIDSLGQKTPDWLANISVWGHLMKVLSLLPSVQTGALPKVPAPQINPGQLDTASPFFGADLKKFDLDSMRREINLQRERIGVLGSAATAADRLAQRQRELDLALKDNIIDQKEYNRALGIAGLENAIQLESRRLGMLGDLAKAEDVLAHKKRQMNQAIQQGAKFTDDEKKAIDARNKMMEQQRRPENQVAFERSLIFLTQEEQEIASRLRSLYIDINSERGAALAQELRINQAMRQLNDIGLDAARGFASDLTRELRAGTSAMEALQKAGINALNKISDKLLDMAISNLWSNAFGGSGGFNILGLFGLGGGAGAFTGNGSNTIGQAHTGGIVGPGLTQRYVHPAYFDDGPINAYHGGGLVGRERLILARDDEEVLTRDNPRHVWNGGGRSSGRGPQTININSTYKIAGAVDSETLGRAIAQSHEAAVNKAVTIASKTAPAHLDTYRKLEG